MARYYEFTIPDTVAEFNLSAPKIIVADRGMARAVTFNVLTAKFGDGYEQRALDGINNKQEEISLTFNNRYYREGNLIAAFFDYKKGSNFLLKITNTSDLDTTQADVEENIYVVCDGYQINYPNEDMISIQTTLRRVYEPLT